MIGEFCKTFILKCYILDSIFVKACCNQISLVNLKTDALVLVCSDIAGPSLAQFNFCVSTFQQSCRFICNYKLF